MLLPRFSIRTLLAVLTGTAILSLFAGQALGGRAWALGVTVAVASVPLAIIFHAAMFLLATRMGQAMGAEVVVARTSRGGIAPEESGPRQTAAQTSKRAVEE